MRKYSFAMQTLPLKGLSCCQRNIILSKTGKIANVKSLMVFFFYSHHLCVSFRSDIIIHQNSKSQNTTIQFYDYIIMKIIIYFIIDIILLLLHIHFSISHLISISHYMMKVIPLLMKLQQTRILTVFCLQHSLRI